MINAQKVAKLAKLSITEEEEKNYQEQLTAVIQYFEEIALVPTDGVEPMITPSELEQVFREDEVEVTISTEEATMNAPERSGNLFRVPPVV